MIAAMEEMEEEQMREAEEVIRKRTERERQRARRQLWHPAPAASAASSLTRLVESLDVEQNWMLDPSEMVRDQFDLDTALIRQAMYGSARPSPSSFIHAEFSSSFPPSNLLSSSPSPSPSSPTSLVPPSLVDPSREMKGVKQEAATKGREGEEGNQRGEAEEGEEEERGEPEDAVLRKAKTFYDEAEFADFGVEHDALPPSSSSVASSSSPPSSSFSSSSFRPFLRSLCLPSPSSSPSSSSSVFSPLRLPPTVWLRSVLLPSCPLDSLYRELDSRFGSSWALDGPPSFRTSRGKVRLRLMLPVETKVMQGLERWRREGWMGEKIGISRVQRARIFAELMPRTEEEEEEKEQKGTQSTESDTEVTGKEEEEQRQKPVLGARSHSVEATTFEAMRILFPSLPLPPPPPPPPSSSPLPVATNGEEGQSKAGVGKGEKEDGGERRKGEMVQVGEDRLPQSRSPGSSSLPSSTDYLPLLLNFVRQLHSSAIDSASSTAGVGLAHLSSLHSNGSSGSGTERKRHRWLEGAAQLLPVSASTSTSMSKRHLVSRTLRSKARQRQQNSS